MPQNDDVYVPLEDDERPERSRLGLYVSSAIFGFAVCALCVSSLSSMSASPDEPQFLGMVGQDIGVNGLAPAPKLIKHVKEAREDLSVQMQRIDVLESQQAAAKDVFMNATATLNHLQLAFVEEHEQNEKLRQQVLTFSDAARGNGGSSNAELEAGLAAAAKKQTQMSDKLELLQTNFQGSVEESNSKISAHNGQLLNLERTLENQKMALQRQTESILSTQRADMAKNVDAHEEERKFATELESRLENARADATAADSLLEKEVLGAVGELKNNATREAQQRHQHDLKLETELEEVTAGGKGARAELRKLVNRTTKALRDDLEVVQGSMSSNEVSIEAIRKVVFGERTRMASALSELEQSDNMTAQKIDEVEVAAKNSNIQVWAAVTALESSTSANNDTLAVLHGIVSDSQSQTAQKIAELRNMTHKVSANVARQNQGLAAEIGTVIAVGDKVEEVTEAQKKDAALLGQASVRVAKLMNQTASVDIHALSKDMKKMKSINVTNLQKEVDAIVEVLNTGACTLCAAQCGGVWPRDMGYLGSAGQGLQCNPGPCTVKGMHCADQLDFATDGNAKDEPNYAAFLCCT